MEHEITVNITVKGIKERADARGAIDNLIDSGIMACEDDASLPEGAEFEWTFPDPADADADLEV